MILLSPFQLHFPAEAWGDTAISNTYPAQCEYEISIATPSLTTTQNSSFLRQSYSGNDFYIELWSFNALNEGYVDLSVLRPVVPIGISLKNRLSLQIDEQEWRTLMDKNYRVIFLPAGMQRIKIFKGITAFLFIIPPLYLFEVMTDQSAKELKAILSPKIQMPIHSWFMKDAIIDMSLKRTIKHLEQLRHTTRQLTAELYICIINIISHYDVSLHNAEALSGHSYAAKAAQSVRKYILQNLKEPGIGNIQRLCRMFGISDKPLSREFLLLTSQSIPDFIKEQRLQIGFKVASDPSLSITGMAHITGYSETSNFIRDFKKRFGLTPMQAKKKPLPRNSGL